ncbi:hypothetical protein QBC34DRAFT_410923 [Podospora aff. communis PSN243]|uniref:Uncharacterized protein n=1 Tax=Podospora aff. communis PSN243 TaxID=3040156 RepID=A0AAV9GEF6_9PEZI|nr:hypothetical protein QBC34DRAFT_410923 [Podospora aff. communis PSN243]
MCGPSTPSSTPRIGARVDLFSLGNLLFHNPTTPNSPLATHVRFSPRDYTQTETDNDDLLVSIHITGDLTKPVDESGLFQQFTLPQGRGLLERDAGVEMALRECVSLEVGQDGIIGRRVSVTRRGVLLGDGIVGFNFGPSVSASL